MDNLSFITEINFLDLFEEKFHANLLEALDSGALSGTEYPNAILKSVLVITAESFTPRSDEGKKLLANLRHFI